MHPSQRPEAGRALGGEHIGGAIADLVLLVRGHLGHQPVQRGVSQLSLAVAALVVERNEGRAEHPRARGRRGAVVALRIGQGHGVPDGRLDRIQEVLVAVVLAFVMVRQLDLGEEVAAEGLAAQLADLALLVVELRLHFRRQGGSGTGRGDTVERPHPGPIGQAEGAAADQEQHQKRHQQYDQERVGVLVPVFLSLLALAAAPAVVPDRDQQPGFRRRRRGRWNRDHHHR